MSVSCKRAAWELTQRSITCNSMSLERTHKKVVLSAGRPKSADQHHTEFSRNGYGSRVLATVFSMGASASVLWNDQRAPDPPSSNGETSNTFREFDQRCYFHNPVVGCLRDCHLPARLARQYNFYTFLATHIINSRLESA